ncbi:MAG: ComEC/Rec2 family competence protein [Phycisphaerae bacterium]|jgi:competence protein ComEC
MTNRSAQVSRTVGGTAPLLPVAGGLIVGVWLDRWLELGPLVYIALFSLATALTLAGPLRRAVGPLLVAVSAACLGGMLHLYAMRADNPASIQHYLSTDGQPPRADRRIARVRGAVASTPRLIEPTDHPFARWARRADRTAFLLDVESIEGVHGDIPVTGLVRVTVDEAVLDLHEADRIEVFGWLYRPQPPRNPGAFDWRTYDSRRGIIARLRCNHKENIRRLGPPSQVPSTSLVSRIRKQTHRMLTGDLSTTADQEPGLLRAMVLGQRSSVHRRLNETFIRAGCAHFLAVSGLHIAVPMSFVWWVGRRLGGSARLCAWLMLGSVLLYVFIAEPRPPVIRAGVMGALFCFSIMLGRPRSGLNWLAAAAILLVITSPPTVFDVGFQLSFAAVLGIMFVTPSLHRLTGAFVTQLRRLTGEEPSEDAGVDPPASMSDRRTLWSRARFLLARSVKRYVLWPLAVSLGAWAATLPIIASFFHQVHPWAPLASLVVFPFAYVLILAAFAVILIEAALPGWGMVLTGAISTLETWLVHLVEWLASWPSATLFVAPPPWWWVTAWYLLLALLVWRFSPRRRKWDERLDGFVHAPPVRSSWLGRALGVAGLWLVVSTLAWSWPRGPSHRLVVHVLSVAAGSAVVVELPDGQVILCDAGNTSLYDVGRTTVVPFLRHCGIRRIARVYVSHPNFDHYNGIPTIADQVAVGPVIINEYFQRRVRPESAAGQLLEMLADRDQPVEVQEADESRWELGGVSFERLWPPPGLEAGVPTNDTSTVLRLTHAGRSVMLTGDIERLAQRRLLEQGDLAADVLILPHHGGVESSTREFIDAVGASALVRSSHQPRAETLNGLYEIAGATPVYNTADVGAVRITIDETGIDVETMWNPAPTASRN